MVDRRPTLSENATGRSEGNDVKISELAKGSGVSVRSLRYYEEQGLLSPQRDASSHRRFETSDVNRVIVIQELYAAGFCSTVVRELLPGGAQPSWPRPRGSRRTLRCWRGAGCSARRAISSRRSTCSPRCRPGWGLRLTRTSGGMLTSMTMKTPPCQLRLIIETADFDGGRDV